MGQRLENVEKQRLLQLGCDWRALRAVKKFEKKSEKYRLVM
jgi:hypothetical protein